MTYKLKINNLISTLEYTGTADEIKYLKKIIKTTMPLRFSVERTQ